MSSSLGKRKRERVQMKESMSAEPDSDEEVRARFRRAFEAKFKPLPQEEVEVERFVDGSDVGDEDDSNDDDGDEEGGEGWDGFSENEAVEVVQHSGGQEVDRLAQRREMRAFMSSKPPSTSDVMKTRTRKSTTGTEEDDTETANLKNDLALQRLLKESHLLDPTSFANSSSTVPEGKARIKALDLRLQDLGVKKVVDKMPMSHRKGIQAKVDRREKLRRKEAAENGIILERAVTAPKTSVRHRDRGIGAPSVGKFQGGTLKLSGKDVKSIKGAVRTPMKRKR